MDFLHVLWLVFLAGLRGQGPACLPGEWECDDGNCISADWRCDADGDCLDGSDETECQRPASSTCPAGQFACVDSVGCVNESGRCDGVRQCPTGSDEEDCVTGGCLEADWLCHNALCVPREGRCDGNDDCLDRSDERDCGLCAEGWWKCLEGVCVSPEQRCDGTRHCSDGSDEPLSCGRVCSVANGGCSHVCMDEPGGALCSCPPGLKLSVNGGLCEDLDECSQPFPPCTQHCTNTLGSFYCHCRKGFVLDRSACRASGGATRLLSVQNRSLGLLGLEGQPFETLWTADSDPLAVTFDLLRGWYYWADGQGSIYKTDGKKSNTVYTGQPGITSLACDWLNGDLYWTNRKTQSIYMGSADGRGFTTLLSKSISPSEMVVLPTESLMFWINVGPGQRRTLDWSWMDGTERRALVVLTTQVAHDLTLDVASRRLYWISDFKNSVETVRVDGTGRYSFPGLLSSRATAGLAVFGNRFYWTDRKGLWGADQNQTNKKALIQKAALPFMTVFHELQQPQGSSACTNSPCQLCLPTKNNPLGFTCSCPDSKILMPDRRCEYPRFVYATAASINMLEFKEGEVIQTQLFITKGILTYDVDWYRDGLYWANRTGQIQHTSLTQHNTQPVPTLLPVCLIKVDQRSGVIFWVSCDQATIGITMAIGGYPRELYHAKGGGIKDMYVDWLRGTVYWLEGFRLLSMGVQGGPAKELLNLSSGFTGTMALDLRANAMLWTTLSAGLSTLSLLQKRTHGYGTRWNITGSVVAAFEPYLLSLSDDTVTLWDRRDGRSLKVVTLDGGVFGVMVALKDIRPVPNQPVCPEPSVLCPGSAVCLNPSQLCDGKEDCPNGFDENLCIKICPVKGDFRCKDSRSCVSKISVCDGRAHCNDGSDELGCPPVAPVAPQTNGIKCRKGSKACRDGLQCVLYSHVCDGEPDCEDGSDEESCEKYSVPPLVPALGSADKPFTSVVSEDVTGLPEPSPPSQAPCVLPAGRCPHSDICISQTQLCDGRKDCPDGSDEGNCVKRCANKVDFRCKDRRSCVSKISVCDGRAHCLDGSDELGCPPVAPVAPQTNGLKCRLGSTPCGDGKQCVLHTHVCDGEPDCEDGSDEESCERYSVPPLVPALGSADKPFTSVVSEEVTGPPEPSPPSQAPCVLPAGRCPHSDICISRTQLCDGRKDCPDGSDEGNCVKRCANKADFRCKDRRSCVSKISVCDGRAHCHDGSDELGCPPVAPVAPQTNGIKCRLGSTPCGDGKQCVLHTHVCDGEPDCEDGSDEQDCSHQISLTPVRSIGQSPSPEISVAVATEAPSSVACPQQSLPCPGSSTCIAVTQFCDGRTDCPKGLDEMCVDKCPKETDFRCKDRRSCVSKISVCDGRAHCHDGSDELGCFTAVPVAPQTNGLKCRKGSKACKDGLQCVLYSHVCDGEPDCEDGSDEEECQLACKEGEFQCADRRRCLPRAQVCDGKPQCPDQSDESDCWTPSKSCQHRCDDNKRCLPATFLCDGEQDCRDGSDERNCASHPNDPPGPTRELPGTPAAPQTRCLAPRLLCASSSLCLSQKQICDGQKDCPDGSDEERCDAKVPSGSFSDSGPRAPLRCRLGSKLCRDGRECVIYSHVCDGEADCGDGSDEEDCSSQCKGEFQCAHGSRCVPLDQVCDGQYQCRDRSDEAACPVLMEGCQHGCDNNTRCIPQTFLCDGERDCADGSDERTCALQQCGPALFRCSSGQCVSDGLRCDGYADCRDRSDEVGCARPPRCQADLRCPHSHECLQKEWLCDGEMDCQDGSDEKNCKFAAEKCRAFQWQCGDSSQCVPLTWRCDGRKDCRNGVDEDKCGAPKCPTPMFQCGTRECLDPALVCNRITNCADGSDEGPGCLQQNCSSTAAPSCDHRCVNTPHGARCYCSPGFGLHTSGTSCVDEDECNQGVTVCQHLCLNTPGSYVCRCHTGFLLEPDQRTCKPKDEAMLLASVQSELLVVGLHTAQIKLLSWARRPVFSLDYHWQQQRVYWLSPDYQSVRWAHLSDPSIKGTLVKGLRSDFLAVDWVGRNLYWVDGLLAQIVAVPLVDYLVRPQNYTVVLDEDLEQPSSLVLLPQRGLMVWSEIGSAPQIEQAGMDGSKRKVLVNKSLSWPASLTFDLLGDRLYWVDEKLRCIGSASLDGENLKILQLDETPSPFSVAVFNDRVFWSDTKRRTIRSADKLTGKDQKVLLKRPGQPFGIKLMHPLSQPALASPCDKTSCSHICLLGPGSTARSGEAALQGPTAVCRCPPGLFLSQNRVTCYPPSESAFILLLSQTSITQVFLHSLQNGLSLKKLPPSHRLLSLPGVGRASTLDADIPTRSVYLADGGRSSLVLLKLSTSKSKQALTPARTILKLKDDEVTALAVDWVTSNVYWSSLNLPDLHLTSIDGAYTTSLLQGSLKGCTSIAVHPPSGRLCYSAVGASQRSSSQVDCAYMDGRKRVVLWKKSNIPTSLVFDNDGKRIFWADLAEGVVGSMGVDGTGYRAYKTGPGLLMVFTSVDNMLLWVTSDRTSDQGTSRLWVSDGVQPRQLWFQMRSSLLSLKAYSSSSQTGSNSCSIKNGGCAQLCLAHPDGRTCRCGWDFRITDVTSCDLLPPCEPGDESCGGRGGVKAWNGVDEAIAAGPAVQKNLTSCDMTHCSGHGRCSGAGLACECNHGYSGEFCQVASGGSHAPAVIATLCVLIGLVAAAVVFKKRRAWRLVRGRSMEKETLMTNMGMAVPDDFYDSHTEDLDSPMDPVMALNPAPAEPIRTQMISDREPPGPQP